ncbi:MAG: hypothetical protein F4213_03345 [Boseongicola sp. SB0677_bin_26]|nr:hypothetical protein [Boseongicola sp. SB0665_bin_10]MYG25050.1 hypothetical protein [Boseongicola sp. SB0677_bin_26]
MSERMPNWWLRVPTTAMRRDDLLQIALDAAADNANGMAAQPDDAVRAQSMTKRQLLAFIQKGREAKLEECARRGAKSDAVRPAVPRPERISAS